MTDLLLKLDTVDDERTVNVKAFAGTRIARACEQATKIATTLGVVVHFDFNGVPCYARPNSDWRTLERAWERLISAENRSRHDMAWSDVPAQSEEGNG
jgi:hypothetical protein